MKIKSGYILREVAGTFIVVAVGEEARNSRRIINLNETGAFIWKQIEKGLTEEEIAKNCAVEFNIDELTALEDAKVFIAKMKEGGLIE